MEEFALADPALQFVGDVPVGDAKVDGNVLLHPVLPPLLVSVEQPAEPARLARGVRGPLVGDFESMSEDRHFGSPCFADE